MKKDNSSKNINNNVQNRIYIGFKTRVVFYLVLFLAFLIGGILFLLNSLDFIQQKNISYTEKSFLDYNVYLKDNDFYDSPYLKKDMLYVASLIDNIKVNFDYNFISDEDINLNFNYKIIGKLLIMDVDNKNTYFEKEYVLLDNKNGSLLESNDYKINEVINIDYDYYNSLANNFKMSYGVDVSSKLIVYLIVDKNSVNTSDKVINNSSYMSLVIPLSLKSVNIKMDYNEIDNTSYLISNSDVIIDNIVCMLISLLLIVLSIVIFIKFMRLIVSSRMIKSKYDKYINKLLNEYDRLIVETSTCPVINNDNVIRIDKFQELLDVRDNLKLPIMYYIVHNHQKCYFYITYDNKIYLNVVKAVDLEENKH